MAITGGTRTTTPSPAASAIRAGGFVPSPPAGTPRAPTQVPDGPRKQAADRLKAQQTASAKATVAKNIKATGWANGKPPAAAGGGNSDPMVTNTDVNPMQKSAFDSASNFEKGITDQTNLETTRELSRFRDEVSQGVQAEGEEAMGRGADSAFFRSKALAGGQRDLADLGAKLAGENLDKHQAAIAGKTDAASAAAGEQNRLNLGTMSANIDQQRTDLEAADQANRFEQQPYDRAMEMTRLLLDHGYEVAGTGTGTSVFGGPSPTSGFGGTVKPSGGSMAGSNVLGSTGVGASLGVPAAGTVGRSVFGVNPYMGRRAA